MDRRRSELLKFDKARHLLKILVSVANNHISSLWLQKQILTTKMWLTEIKLLRNRMTHCLNQINHQSI